MAVLATVLLWWANEQSLDIQRITGTTFQIPEGQILLQIGTLVAAGFAFGASVEAGRQSTSRSHIGTLAVASLVPLSIVSYFYLHMVLHLLPSLPLGISRFLWSQLGLTSSAVAVGFFIAGMSAPALRKIGS